MNTSVNVQGLIKKYGENTVIKGISFEVAKGEIFGLLGINGAGKTTTLECIQGIRTYNNGEITLDGKIGVQLQSSSLPQNIKIIETLKLFSHWNKITPDFKLLDTFGLTPIKQKTYHQLSTGQKRRLHLALALINNPDIIFLDEPTAGLDVEGRVALHVEIRALKERGKTIVLASHDMAEVESLCDRIAILKAGELAFIGTPNQLMTQTTYYHNIYLKPLKPLTKTLLNTNTHQAISEGYYHFKTDTMDETLFELLSILKKEENKVIDLKIERASLEEGFMTIAKGEM